MIDKNKYNLNNSSLSGEVWRYIDREIYPELGVYQISNYGRIFNSKTNQFLYGRSVSKLGYVGIVFWIKDRKFKRFLIHRLVAKYFLDIPDSSYKNIVHHKDNNPSNNHIDNLEWATPDENYKYAINSGRVNNRGEKNVGAKLNEEQVMKIRVNVDNKPIHELAKIYGVTRRTILNIQTRRSWIHV